MAVELAVNRAGGNVVRIEGRVEWRVFLAEGGDYVGICDRLGLTLQAESWAGMMEEIGSVQAAIFKDLRQTGDLDQFLRDHGWRAVGVPNESAVFDLPFFPQLVEAAAHDSAAPAH